jgi:two-component system, NtrC family, response regulator HydG
LQQLTGVHMDCFSGGEISKECLETVLETMAEGLFMVDTDGIIRYCNKALEDLTGKSRDELIGQRCCSLMSDLCDPPPSCSLFAKEEILDTECRILHASGRAVPVLKNARIIRDRNGAVVGGVETLTDISILKTTELRLAALEESVHKRDHYGAIVGKSRPMQEIYSLIDLAAASNATILISGETGTGKELVARAIHYAGARKDAPIVKVNCSALPENLLESELFGHTRGAFTGAIRDKTGRFETADRGTLFIDEIGELSPMIQVKLLRFLQEKEFERVGENLTRKADVRIIAATHRDLRRMVSEGRFREDLFYRLKVFPIHLPPLRDRKEDIGPLVEHFITRFNTETGKSISGLTHDAAVTMMDYCWPGNIRELENAIEHAFVTCQEERIGLFDLPLEIRRVELRKGICATDPEDTVSAGQPMPIIHGKRLSDQEFTRILNEAGGNKSEVARRLGVDRTTVWRRIKRLGMEG